MASGEGRAGRREREKLVCSRRRSKSGSGRHATTGAIGVEASCVWLETEVTGPVRVPSSPINVEPTLLAPPSPCLPAQMACPAPTAHLSEGGPLQHCQG